MTEDQIIADIIRREGDAYTEHPHDRGGATKYGITQRSWRDYLKPIRELDVIAGLPAHVRDLTEQHARTFYRERHVKPFAWIDNDALRALVVDCGVLHGITRTTSWLQAAAGVARDGKIGPVTRAAVNTQPMKTYAALLGIRLRFLAEIVADDPTQLVFLRGWIKRATEFLR